MEAFNKLNGLVIPLDRSNIDTDAIIPKQFLKSVKRSGFGPHLFDHWRYLDRGELGIDHSTRSLKKDFILNQNRYHGGEILLTRENFGCGSSREHAAWALLEYGIRCIIAISFADIFYNNCCKNGILPIVLDKQIVDVLFCQVYDSPGYKVVIDLSRQLLITPDQIHHSYKIDKHRKKSLLTGLDEVGQTLLYSKSIKAYEEKHRSVAPWLF